MMGTLGELCSYFSISPKRQNKLSEIINEDATNQLTARKMVSLSQTRWVERYLHASNNVNCYLSFEKSLLSSIELFCIESVSC